MIWNWIKVVKLENFTEMWLCDVTLETGAVLSTDMPRKSDRFLLEFFYSHCRHPNMQPPSFCLLLALHLLVLFFPLPSWLVWLLTVMRQNPKLSLKAAAICKLLSTCLSLNKLSLSPRALKILLDQEQPSFTRLALTSRQIWPQPSTGSIMPGSSPDLLKSVPVSWARMRKERDWVVPVRGCQSSVSSISLFLLRSLGIKQGMFSTLRPCLHTYPAAADSRRG